MSKKKILTFSDDLRMSSGVGTMTKEMVMGTINQYDWVQVGGAIKHPEDGNVVDMNDAAREETGVKDASLTIYPISGYGNQELLRQMLVKEQPDAIMHYTDPRFWQWLYEMEHEIRQHVPIFYYNVWDDLPYPQYNEFFYESSDLIMNISKQTDNIVKNVWTKYPPEDWQVTYVPHGINDDLYHPLTELHGEWNEFEEFRKQKFDGNKYDFVLYYNNRNIRRKMTSDVILAFHTFCSTLSEEEADKCALLMHTQPKDENGTDLPLVVEAICPNRNVYFSDDRLDFKEMNFLYNMSDVTINIASNEGFGLATAESLMSGTPIIVNITGGLQDQCGFKYKGKHLDENDYSWVHSLHNDKEWENNPDLTHGEWVKPVWPRTRSLQGSMPTPYIFDDRCRWDEVAEAIKYWYDLGNEERERCGELGREWMHLEEVGMTAKLMCQRFMKSMDTAFETWKPRKRYSLYKV